MSIVLLTSPALPVFPSFWLLYCANSKQYVDLSNKTPQHSPSNPSPTPLNPPEQTMLRRAIVNKRTLLGSRFLSTLPQSSVGPVIPPTLAALTDRAQVDESTSLMSSLVSDLNQKLDAVRMGGGDRRPPIFVQTPREVLDALLSGVPPDRLTWRSRGLTNLLGPRTAWLNSLYCGGRPAPRARERPG